MIKRIINRRVPAIHDASGGLVGGPSVMAAPGPHKPIREDLMSLEIIRALEVVGEKPTATRIWSVLKTYAGRPESCIEAVTGKGIRWLTAHGDVRYLTIGLLKKRLGRKKT